MIVGNLLDPVEQNRFTDSPEAQEHLGLSRLSSQHSEERLFGIRDNPFTSGQFRWLGSSTRCKRISYCVHV